jgi:pheromone shutdown protein TraB
MGSRYTAATMNAIEAAEHAGIDLSLIDESLRLTPEQRAIQHQVALEMALQLEAAFQARKMNNHNDGTQRTIEATVQR